MMGLFSRLAGLFRRKHPPTQDVDLLVGPLRESTDRMTKASNDFMRTMQIQACQAQDDRIDPDPYEVKRAVHH